ncbi:MAG: phosphate acyltransferase PlsX [Bryobacter sp.]|nr:phosphate acyltransferase PlsX [Bryobacter sp.]
MLTIAVDAMGGDHAPKAEVEGALRAAKQFNHRVILVGREEIIREELRAHGGIGSLPVEIHHASEVITMEDSAAKAMRSKKDSSVRVACRLVRDGVAQGVVSAGNTGAVMATSKTVQGVVRGLIRPALAQAFPTLKGSPTVLLDIGANVDSTPAMLAQFAIMGNAYSRVIFDVSRPRVGLLSIGEEEHKGNALVHGAQPLLKKLPIHYIGNVEGRDLYTGYADVVVCDGFMGNVALKVSEGLVDVIKQMLKQSLTSTITRQVGSVLARNGFDEFRRRTDYSEYGGAPLLGVRGVTIICHGRSNANAIKNAIRVAAEYAEGRVNERIEEGLSAFGESLPDEVPSN